MAIYLSNLNEAYGSLLTEHWEKKENPQHYNYETSQFVNPTPQRHLLGILSGNNVSLIKGNMVDLESDLKGINIPLTSCPWRQYQPPQKDEKEIVRENTKHSLRIHTQKVHLPVYQMMAYPSVIAPVPLVNEVCMKPEKY